MTIILETRDFFSFFCPSRNEGSDARPLVTSSSVSQRVGEKSFVQSKSVFKVIGQVIWEYDTIVFRAFVGLTIGGILASSYAYPIEFIGVKWRALTGSIPVWGVGAVTFSLLVWALRDWSHLHIATAVCTAAFLLGWM